MTRIHYSKAAYDALLRRALAHTDTPLRRVAEAKEREPHWTCWLFVAAVWALIIGLWLAGGGEM